MLSDEHARLNLPRAVNAPSRIEPKPIEGTVMVPAGAGASLTSRRQWLSGLTGGALSSLEDSQHGRHGDPVLTLVHRITFGFSLAEYERAKALGFQGYLDEQLDHLSIDDSEMDARLSQRFPILFMSPKEIYDSFGALNYQVYRAQLYTKNAIVARATNSKRQLYERMCEFWSDHFNIEHAKGLEWVLLPEHDRTVIRPHALGSFPEMLNACAFSGAMLYYLDNWLNVREAPQQNYARELLELHTLSVHGGYNEFDVQEVSRCFTGWTLNGDSNSPDWLRGVYDPTLHSSGRKLVLGHTIPSAPPVARPGEPVAGNDAQRVLEILSTHPSTAAFLARKLIRRFLTPTPPQDLIDRVATTYLDTDGDIKAMLRVILTPENLGAHSPVLAPKYRRPFHFMVSLFRALDATVKRGDVSRALSDLTAMGQGPFEFGPPTGYPDDFRSWGGLLLSRWSFAADMLRHDVIYPGVTFIAPSALQDKLEIHGASERPGLAKRMDERLFGHMLTRDDLEALQQFIDDYPLPFDTYALYDCLTLASSLPGFQWS
jgi:uncharacterized protein (DUF1800 family)